MEAWMIIPNALTLENIGKILDIVQRNNPYAMDEYAMTLQELAGVLLAGPEHARMPIAMAVSATLGNLIYLLRPSCYKEELRGTIKVSDTNVHV